MYIDEIKKLLKDIEKSIQGDRRWIENEDFLLRDKLDKIYKQKTEPTNKSIPIFPNEFILPQYQKKNNIANQLTNFNKKEKEIIKLPSQIVNPKKINNTRFTKKNESSDLNLNKGFNLSVSADDISGKSITGDGSITIEDLKSNTDLSKINSKGDVNININTDIDINQKLPDNSKITLKNSNVKISAKNINNSSILGNGDLTITDLSSDTDLSKIKNKGNNKIIVDKDIDFKGKLCDGNIIVEKGKTLRISAKEANGRTITGEGTVIITDIENYPNADLSNINTKNNILDVEGTTDFTGKLNPNFKVNLKNGSIFSISEDKLSKIPIDGNGQIAIKDKKSTGKLANIKVKELLYVDDIKKIDLSKISKDDSIYVPEGETLYLTASEADGRTIIGDGNVIITDIDKSPNADLSKIETFGEVLINVDKDTEFKGKLNSKSKINFLKDVNLTISDEILNNAKITGKGTRINPCVQKGGSNNDKNKINYPCVEDSEKIDEKLEDENLIYIPEGSTKVYSAKDLDGKTVIGKGKLIINDLDKNPNVDLSNVNPEGGTIMNINKDIKFNGQLPKDKSNYQVNVTKDSKFELSAENADKLKINGEGLVNVNNISNKDDVDLSKINTDNGTNLIVEENTKFNGKLPNNKTKVILKNNSNLDIPEENKKKLDISGKGFINKTKFNDIIEIPEGTVKEYTAKELDGKTVIGKGKLIITDLDKFPNADLSNVDPEGGTLMNIDKNIKFNGQLPKDKSKYKVNVTKNSKFEISAENADNLEIDGEGSVSVDKINKKSYVDLSKINTKKETELIIDNDTDFIGKLPKNKTKVTLKNDANLNISDDKKKDLDISGKGSINKTKPNVIEIPEGSTKTYSAKDLDGKTVIGGGKLIITDLDKFPNADLSNVNPKGGSTLDIKKNTNFKGKLPKDKSKYKANVTKGSIFELSADNVDKLKIDGDGSVNVNNIDKKSDVDLSGINSKGKTKLLVDKNTSFKGKLPVNKDNIEVLLDKDSSFNISADKADKLKITGKGTVNVTDIKKKSDSDLSKITTNNKINLVRDKDIIFNGKTPPNGINDQSTFKSYEIKYLNKLNELEKNVNSLGNIINMTLGEQDGGFEEYSIEKLNKLDLII